MLKLPFNNISILLHSIEGEVVDIMYRDLGISWWTKLQRPIALCIIKDNESNDYYHLQLIDLVKCELVGDVVQPLLNGR